MLESYDTFNGLKVGALGLFEFNFFSPSNFKGDSITDSYFLPKFWNGELNFEAISPSPSSILIWEKAFF